MREVNSSGLLICRQVRRSEFVDTVLEAQALILELIRHKFTDTGYFDRKVVAEWYEYPVTALVCRHICFH